MGRLPNSAPNTSITRRSSLPTSRDRARRTTPVSALHPQLSHTLKCSNLVSTTRPWQRLKLPAGSAHSLAPTLSQAAAPQHPRHRAVSPHPHQSQAAQARMALLRKEVPALESPVAQVQVDHQREVTLHPSQVAQVVPASQAALVKAVTADLATTAAQQRPAVLH